MWVAKSCITVCFTYSLRIAIFWLNTDISQGSEATHLVLGGVFKYSFVTNVLLNLTLKEFRKSVNIWWSYGQEFGVLFETQCITCSKTIKKLRRQLSVACQKWTCSSEATHATATKYRWLYRVWHSVLHQCRLCVLMCDCMTWSAPVCHMHYGITDRSFQYASPRDLVSGINSKLLSTKHALISPVLTHPVLWVALPTHRLTTLIIHHPLILPFQA